MSPPKKQLVFFHQNYPAQFGPISQFLLQHYDVNIAFISEFVTKPVTHGIRHIAYKPHHETPVQSQPTNSEHRDSQQASKSTPKPYFFSRFFEQESRSMYGSYLAFERACKQGLLQHPPDVLIGHVGFGNLMLFHVAYPDIPTVGFFEYFYSRHGDTRPEYDAPWENQLRRPLRNATQLLELEYCSRGYSPTPYQRGTFPAAYQHKLETLFDGVDTTLYSPGEVAVDSLLKPTWPKDAPIITFVSRGLEAYRGFDRFMEAAHIVCQQHPDVHFVIAGREKTCYGSEMIHIKEKSFKQHVLKQKNYDLSRFHFMDWLPEPALVDLLRLSQCHVYWTVPFTLSWSFFQAMATGALILGSDTAPVRDVLRHGENGLMIPPDDVAAMAEQMLAVLREPKRFLPMRQAARQTIVENYSFNVCLPKLAEFYLRPELS